MQEADIDPRMLCSSVENVETSSSVERLLVHPRYVGTHKLTF